MREVEIMARLDDVDQFIDRLSAIGVLVREVLEQDDRIYVPKPLVLAEVDAYITPILRIRTENGIHRFTLKRNAEPGTDSLNNIEHEVVVSSASTMDQILDELGQHVCMNVVKTRRLAVYGDFELSIDSVVGLGDFVEVEVLSEEADDVTGTRERMWDFLERLGIPRSAQVTESYDRQIAAKGR